MAPCIAFGEMKWLMLEVTLLVSVLILQDGHSATSTKVNGSMLVTTSIYERIPVEPP